MNPLYQAASGANNKTAPNNSLNNAAPSVRHTFNRFNNGYTHYTSANYGEYTPFFSQICNPADVKKFRSISQIRTLTLNSPLYSKVKMNKDYFFVPYDAILPINWQKIYRNPSQGDDVPDDANSTITLNSVVQLIEKFVQALNYFFNGASIDDIKTFNSKVLTGRYIYRSFPLIDAFLSSGGLLSRLGYNLSHSFKFTFGSNKFPTWDRFAEHLYPLLFPINTAFPFSFDSGYQGYKFFIANTDNLMNDGFPEYLTISPKDALSIFRYFIDNIDNSISAESYSSFIRDVLDTITSPSVITEESIFASTILDTQNTVFNFDQCVSYNLICSQFYSNGNVDAIYNAELYRDLLGSHIHLFNKGFDTFAYNGINTQYDMASGHYMKKAFDVSTNVLFNNELTDISDAFAALNYLRNIFCLQNSLKYGDYFTGSHTRPLAVGDVTAPVVGNSVSAVDVTKAIAYQRFLNVVVKLKNNFADYLRSLFGTLPAPDYHEAKFISHSEGSVDGFEVANTTTEEQGNLVTLLHNVNENFEFELTCDMPGIAMGIVSFVASRAYCQTKDRMFMRRDRYDMFNPMLQTIGDQPILGFEKNSIYSTPYGYVQRYMEYKQRYNIASGAFVDVLKSYCIICDSPTSSANSLELISPNVNSVSIRLTPRELDRFFKPQSAWSYGNSFHFICEFDNQVDDIREADYTPSIL